MENGYSLFSYHYYYYYYHFFAPLFIPFALFIRRSSCSCGNLVSFFFPCSYLSSACCVYGHRLPFNSSSAASTFTLERRAIVCTCVPVKRFTCNFCLASNMPSASRSLVRRKFVCACARNGVCLLLVCWEKAACTQSVTANAHQPCHPWIAYASFDAGNAIFIVSPHPHHSHQLHILSSPFQMALRCVSKCVALNSMTGCGLCVCGPAGRHGPIHFYFLHCLCDCVWARASQAVACHSCRAIRLRIIIAHLSSIRVVLMLMDTISKHWIINLVWACSFRVNKSNTSTWERRRRRR